MQPPPLAAAVVVLQPSPSGRPPPRARSYRDRPATVAPRAPRRGRRRRGWPRRLQTKRDCRRTGGSTLAGAAGRVGDEPRTALSNATSAAAWHHAHLRPPTLHPYKPRRRLPLLGDPRLAAGWQSRAACRPTRAAGGPVAPSGGAATRRRARHLRRLDAGARACAPKTRRRRAPCRPERSAASPTVRNGREPLVAPHSRTGRVAGRAHAWVGEAVGVRDGPRAGASAAAAATGCATTPTASPAQLGAAGGKRHAAAARDPCRRPPRRGAARAATPCQRPRTHPPRRRRCTQ